jgi:hypothetical protein
MTPTREQAEVIEATRPDFERYFLESRKSKGANRRPTFARFPDDTYQDDHTQRHWWTWQQSAMAARAQALEDAENECRAVAEGFGGLAAGPFCTDFGKHTHQSMAAGALNCAAVIEALKGKQ